MTNAKKIALPLLVLVILLALTGVASAQIGKGWFEVDDLRVMGRADVAGESTFRDTVTIKDNVTLTGTVSAASLLISGNGDVTGNLEVTDHLLTQAELYMIPPANLTVTNGGIVTPTAAVMVLTAAGTVGDTTSAITVNGGKLTATIVGGGSWGNPYLVYGNIARAAGRVLVGQLSLLSGDTNRWIGWNEDATPSAFNNNTYLYIASTSFWPGGGALIGSPAVSAVALPLRATGCFLFGRTAAFWSLIWVSHIGSVATMYPAFSATGAIAGNVSVPYFRVPDTLWLPTPLVSDGFASAFGTSDGLGHAEGIAGGIGAGGGGVAWTQQVGAWEVASGKAKPASLDGAIAIAIAPATTANVVIGAACVRNGGDVGVVLNYADADNYVRALHNGTNVQLIKTVAGTPTTLVSAATTYSAGARLVVTKDDTKYRVYYNNALVGTEQTIADAGIVANTLHGLFSTDASNTLDDFVVYARGKEGQYAELDAYSFD